MKKLSILLLAVFALIVTSCGGGASYSSEKTKELVEKIKSGGELTQSDYSAMIDQCTGGLNVVMDKIKAIDKSDKQQAAVQIFALMMDAETQEVVGNCEIMERTLKNADLDDSNKKKFEEYQAKEEQMGQELKESMNQ